MNSNILDQEIDYCTARLETELAVLKEMTEQIRIAAKELEAKRIEVAGLEKAMLWRMRLRVRRARQALQELTPLRRSARIAARTQTTGLRRSARIAARR